MSGHPPTMHSTFEALQARTASSDTLPSPNDRWNQTRGIPRSTHCRTTSTDAAGAVAITTPSNRTGDRAEVGVTPDALDFRRFGIDGKDFVSGRFQFPEDRVRGLRT